LSGVTGWSGWTGWSGVGIAGQSGWSGWSGFSGVAGPDMFINYVIDGGGSAIASGSKGYMEIPLACSINGWTMMADVSGSIVVDVHKCNYANFPSANTIAGSELPSLTSVIKNQNTSLTTWTPVLSKGDILEFLVDSADTVKRVTVSIRAART
jgi:hypothetical protein